MAEQSGFGFLVRLRLPSEAIKRGPEQVASIAAKTLPKGRTRMLIVDESQTFDNTVPDGQLGLIRELSGEFEVGSGLLSPANAVAQASVSRLTRSAAASWGKALPNAFKLSSG